MSVNEIYQYHTECIDNSINYINIVESIIGDMLMNRVKFSNNKMILNLNPRCMDLIENWYSFAEHVKKYNTVDMIVYRGVYNMNKNSKYILQPIPFSSCICSNYAKEWISNYDSSFTMKIHIKKNTLYTYLGNINEGNEVVLSAGLLIKKDKTSDENDFVEYDFISYNLDDMMKKYYL